MNDFVKWLDENDTDLELIVNAYIEAMLWTEEEQLLEDCDQNEDVVSTNNVSPESVTEITLQCVKFLTMTKEYLNDLATPQQIGHDFWLTRNGHGVGFWSRPEIYGDDKAEKLSEIATNFGEQWLYIGDDHKLYI